MQQYEDFMRRIPWQPAPKRTLAARLGLSTRFADNVIYGIPERPLDTVTAFLATAAPAAVAMAGAAAATVCHLDHCPV